MLAILRHLIVREVSACLRRPAQCLMPLAFMGMVVSLFPLAIGPDSGLLEKMAPGVIWVAILLALMMGLENLFEKDLQDGTLEWMLLSPQPIWLVVVGKVAGFWVAHCLPLIAFAPLLGLQLGMPVERLPVLSLSLLLGTPTLCLIGAAVAALMLSIQRTALLVLLVLPVAVPVVVFACGVVTAYNQAVLTANLSLLGAFFILTALTMPWATAAALKLGVESA